VTRIPIACTLDASGLDARLADWQRVLDHVAHREPAPGGIRLTFDPDVPVGELAELANAERGCCAFFSFTLRLDADGTTLEVAAPEEAAPLLAEVFGT
jgi:MerR family copper efflux transcriptional regulator